MSSYFIFTQFECKYKKKILQFQIFLIKILENFKNFIFLKIFWIIECGGFYFNYPPGFARLGLYPLGLARKDYSDKANGLINQQIIYMKISVIKPTKIVASIECKYDSYGFYNLYLIMDGEIVDQHRWLLRDREYNCDANIMSTILCAFGLSSKQYSLLHPTWMSVEVLTRRCDDFTLNVFEESIVK